MPWQRFPDADNTLVIYILGDNGASAEGGLDGIANESRLSTACSNQSKVS
jgi:arylsulfatase